MSDKSPAAPAAPASGGLTGAKRRGAYHHGDLRRALMDAAVALIEREGPKGLTLRGAARLAGVSEAAPYRHFADKDALLAAVAAEGFREMTAYMREVGAPLEDEPLRRFERLGRAYVEFAAANPARFRVMTGPDVADVGAHPDLRDAGQECFGLLIESVAAAQAAGEIVAGDPKPLAMGAWAMVHGLALLLIDGQLAGVTGEGDVAIDRLMQKVAGRLLWGLAPRS